MIYPKASRSATKEIVWRYGVTDQPGREPGQLHYPDGFDVDVFRDWTAWLVRRRPSL